MSQRHKPIAGSHRPSLEKLRRVGDPHPKERIKVTVVVRPARSDAKSHELHELGALMPHERNHFSREHFEERHGADPEDFERIAEFAEVHGLHVLETNKAHRTIRLSGTIEAIGTAFNVDLAHYEHHEGVHRAHIGHVHVPHEIHDIVEGVFGLDNLPTGRRHRGHRSLAGFPVPDPEKIPHYTPIELAEHYEFPPGTDGSGQTIALLQFNGGFKKEDLDAYFDEIGLKKHPAVVPVSVGDAKNKPTNEWTEGDGEVMLDIEVAGGVAPGAKIVVYFADNDNAGWVNCIKTAVHDKVHKPTIISISWGDGEPVWEDETVVKQINQSFEDAAKLGITVLVASGDDGSNPVYAFGRKSEEPDTFFPASSPYVLACGGSHLDAKKDCVTSEVVWDEKIEIPFEDGKPMTREMASGGGVSSMFELPEYQSGVKVPDPPNGRPPNSPSKGRGVPDLAGHAYCQHGYLIRVDGKRTVSGGTSAVAPLWAGLIARINQSLGSNVGYINPLIYKKLAGQGVFRSITSGSNGAYRAEPGWDACTGWGSINGKRLLEALRPPAAVRRSPSGRT